MFSRPVAELIRTRFSCRSYSDLPLGENVRSAFQQVLAGIQRGPFGNEARFVLAASSEGDLRSLRGLGTYGFIKGAPGFIIGVIRDGEKNHEDFGYLMEAIILHATDLGLGTCWLGGTFQKSSFAQRASLADGEWVPAVSALGTPAGRKRWLERTIRSRADADRRLAWEQLFFDQNGDALTPGAAGEYRDALEMVRLGPSASNKQPWRVVREGSCFHFLLKRTPGYRESFLVRLATVADMQRIDMGIAMCHFELAAKESGLSGSWEFLPPVAPCWDEGCEFVASWGR